MVKTSTAGGMGSIPGWGTKIPQAVWLGQKKKKKKKRKGKKEGRKEREANPADFK